MDRRLSIALVVILVLLGGYIWYTFLRQGATPPSASSITPEPTPILFLSLKGDEVQALEVRDVSGQTIRVVRTGETWNMEQPAQGPADGRRIQDLVFTLSQVNADRRLEPPADLAPFGLKPPQTQIKFIMQDGTSTALNVGSENPDNNYVYVMKDQDPAVYLIDFSNGETIHEFVSLPPYTPTPTPSTPPTATPAPSPTDEPTAAP